MLNGQTIYHGAIAKNRNIEKVMFFLETDNWCDISQNEFIFKSKEIDNSNRAYHLCILKNVKNIGPFLSSISGSRPILNGMWKHNGEQYSKIHIFDKEMHLMHSNKQPLNAFKFSGWAAPTAY